MTASEPERTESTESKRKPGKPSPASIRRQPPPMRVVTKGWWTLEERQADSAELEKADRNE
jgi:hypothetical protein